MKNHLIGGWFIVLAKNKFGFIKQAIMKRNQILSAVIITGFIVGLSSCCTLQELNYKVYAVPQLSNISGDSYDANNAAIIGIFAGGDFELGCIAGNASSEQCNCPAEKTPHSGFSFSPGLNFSKQGGAYTETGGFEGKIVSSYLNIPILARYRTGGGFYAEAGLQPGILLSAKDKYDGNTDDFKSYFKSFDVGLPMGIGYDFKNGIGIGVRVIPGIMNIDKEKGDVEDEPNKNFAAGLMLSYSFSTKKKK